MCFVVYGAAFLVLMLCPFELSCPQSAKWAALCKDIMLNQHMTKCFWVTLYSGVHIPDQRLELLLTFDADRSTLSLSHSLTLTLMHAYVHTHI